MWCFGSRWAANGSNRMNIIYRSMKKNMGFLGQGWGFPPDFSLKQRSVKMVSEEQDINESLIILFSTQFGERIMQHNYGCNLQSLVFEKFDTTAITLLKSTIETAIIYHEPRIKLIKIEAIDTIREDGSILLDIQFMIRTTNTRTNMIYPFYLSEASGDFYS